MLQSVLPGYLVTTIATLVLAVSIASLIALLSAYCVTFYKLPFSGIVDTMLVLPLAITPYIVAIVYREVFATSFFTMQSIFGLAAVMAITTYPYIYVLLRVSFQRRSAIFLESAASLGVGRREALRRVIIPLAIPALALGNVLVAMESVGDFGAADVLSVPTLTLAVRRILFSSFDEQLALQVALLSSVIPLFVVISYWWFISGRSFAAPTNRPHPISRETLSPVKERVIFVLCLLPPLMGFILPVAILLSWFAQAFAKFDFSTVLTIVLNTVLLSLLVAVIVAAIGLLVTLAARKGRRNVWRIASIGVLSINLALPSIVIGLALLTLTGWGRDWALVDWASDTILVLCSAMVLKFAAFGYFSVESTYSTIPEKLEEAGLAVQCSAGEVLRRVLLPISSDGVIIAATLAFLIAAKELTMSLTLHPFGFKSLAMSTYHLAKVDAHPEAAVLACCLIALCLYPVLSLHRWIMR